MTHTKCCRFRPASLNNLPNSETLHLRGERPQTLPRVFPQNPVETPSSSTGTETLQPTRDIFVPSNSGREPSEDQDPQDPELGPKRTTMFFRISNKKSNSRLHDIAKVVRKRVARESEASKGSSKKSSKPSLKEEDLARRRELRRALHRRLEEELLRDSEDGYDTDAVPIIDFAGTSGGNDDSNRGGVDQIRYVAARCKASPTSSARGLQRPSYLPGQDWQSAIHMGVSVRIPRIIMINRTNFNPKASHIPGATLAESSYFPLGRFWRVSASVSCPQAKSSPVHPKHYYTQA